MAIPSVPTTNLVAVETRILLGGFDDAGFYWVVDFINEVIRKMDPDTGASLFTVGIESELGFNGVAFVNDTLYAVRGAFGDPPHLFGTMDLTTGAFVAIGRTIVGVGAAAVGTEQESLTGTPPPKRCTWSIGPGLFRGNSGRCTP